MKPKSQSNRIQSYLGSEIPKLDAEMFVPKTGQNYQFTLDDLRGHFTVLIFYPGNFSPLPLPELSKFKDISKDTKLDYNLMAVSTDTIESHKAFCELDQQNGGLKGLDIVLIADKTGNISKQFHVFDEAKHNAFLTYTILSPEIQVLAQVSYDYNVGGNTEIILELLNSYMEKEMGDKMEGESKSSEKSVSVSNKDKNEENP